jgi:hypothetical protein
VVDVEITPLVFVTVPDPLFIAVTEPHTQFTLVAVAVPDPVLIAVADPEPVFVAVAVPPPKLSAVADPVPLLVAVATPPGPEYGAAAAASVSACAPRP